MKKILLTILIVLIMAGGAMASDFKLTPPSTLSDGSAIPEIWEAQLAYKFYCGAFPNNYTVTQDAGHLEPNTFNECSYPITLADGFWYCAATAYFLFDTSLESGKSNEIFFVVSGGVVPSVVPSPPSFRFKK